MNRSLRIALVGAPAFFLLVGCAADTSGSPPMNDSDPSAYESAASGQEMPDGWQRVTLVDQGLQMPRGTQSLPAGWALVQDLATDPATGEAARSTLDIRGPHGELLRGLGSASYGPTTGTSFEQTWQQMATRGAQGEADVSLGSLRPSAVLERSRSYRKAARMASQNGMRVDALEAPVRGTREGRPVGGVVYVMHWAFASGGGVQATLVLSPADRLPETLRLNEQIAESYQPDPAFEQRVLEVGQAGRQQSAALHQQRMGQIDQFGQQMTAGHNQRMADGRASFNAHQQRMQGRYDAADQQLQNWQAGQASIDERHRRAINGINGTADVYDAQTGQTYSGVQDGAGAYWTDPTNGAVVGTDAYRDNPDAYRYNQGTNLDDVYDAGND